jgi:hypothetical protein
MARTWSLMLVVAALLVLLAGTGSCEKPVHLGVPTLDGRLPVLITLSPGTDPSRVTVRVDGVDVTASFAPAAGGLEGSIALPPPGPFRISITQPFPAIEIPFTTWYLFESPGAAPILSGIEPSHLLPLQRTAWLRFRFQAALSQSQIGSYGFGIECDGRGIQRTAHLPGDGSLILNPTPELPAGSACRVAWRGATGAVEQVTFTVAGAAPGPPAVALYDRTDPFQLAPFPDDFWLVGDPSLPSGMRIDFPLPPFPDAFQRQAYQALIAQTRGVDGWSRQPPIVLAFSHALSSTALPADLAASQDPLAAIWLVDVDPASPDYGHRIPYEMRIRNDLAPDLSVDHVALLFPTIDLRERGQYAVVVKRSAYASGEPGRPFGRSAFLEQVLANPDPGDAPAVVKTRQSILPVLAALRELPDVPLPAEDVALVVRLSIRTHPSVADLVSIKEQTLAAPPPQLVFPDPDTAPCPEPGRFCIQTSSTRGLVAYGWVELPDYRNAIGVFEHVPATGLPVQTGTNQVPVVLSLPVQALDGPVSPIMFQHGNPGSPSDLTFDGDNGHLDDAGFALLGIQDTLNREIGQDVGLQTQVFFFFLVQTQQMPAYWNQTGADMIHFLRAIQGAGSLDLMRRGANGQPEIGSDGNPEIDPSQIFYKGVSEGSNNAERFLPFAPEVLAATATVGAARLGEIFLLDFADSLKYQLGALLPQLRPVELWIGLSFFQIGFDPQDGHTFLPYLYPQPLLPFAGSTDTTPPSSLWIEGIGDASDNGIRAAAHALGIPHVRPVAVPVPTLVPVDAPLRENLGPGLTAGFFQYDPPQTPSCVAQGVLVPHACAQIATEAKAQRLHFYQSALSGSPEIIDPLP